MAEPSAPTLAEVREPAADDGPLATLDAGDLYRVTEQKRIIKEAQMVLSMLNCSYRVLWAEIQRKHDLPANVEMDESTGELFASKEAAKANGADNDV